MTKICIKCNKEFDENRKKCPVCGSKLKPIYTQEELEEIKKQNDDMTVINMMLM